MPRDAMDFMPSWEADVGRDEYTESGGGPTGDVTEEQVRKFLVDKGFNDEEIDGIMANATKQHEGGEAKDPGDKAAKPINPTDTFMGSEDDLAEGVTPDNSVSDTRSPKPMFQGDRMGR